MFPYHIDDYGVISPHDLDAYFLNVRAERERIAMLTFDRLRPLPTSTVVMVSTPTGPSTFYDVWGSGSYER